MHRRRRIVRTLIATCLLATPSGFVIAEDLSDQVLIRRDEFGVPHILAETEEAASFGYAKTPPWYQRILDAFAGGYNLYIEKHRSELPEWVHIIPVAKLPSLLNPPGATSRTAIRRPGIPT